MHQRLQNDLKIRIMRFVWSVLRFGGSWPTRKKDLRKRQNFFIRAVWLCVIICYFLAADFEILLAQKNHPAVESQSETKDDNAPYRPWKATIPRPKEFDWSQFTSGEWLKGKIKVLYRYKLEFDSDKLGLLELDWEDVENVVGH
jgi:hypothetical protein